MKHLSKKTPVIEDEIGRTVAGKLLEQIHGCRGLVRYLETKAAINGKHLRMEPVEDMPESRLFKVMTYKARWQGEEDFMQDITEMGQAIVRLARNIHFN